MRMIKELTIVVRGKDKEIPGSAYKSSRFRPGLYKTKSNREAAPLLEEQIRQQLPEDYEMFEGLVKINMNQFRRVPKYLRKKIKTGDPCNRKPDFSNQFKFIEDRLSGIVFLDDKSVWGTFGEQDKVWDLEDPRVEVKIRFYEHS